MSIRYSEDEIARMLAEEKPLPDGYRSRMQLRDKRGHKERELEVVGASGNTYKVILRQDRKSVV